MVVVLCCAGICLFGRACSFVFDNVMLFSLGEYCGVMLVIVLVVNYNSRFAWLGFAVCYISCCLF